MMNSPSLFMGIMLVIFSANAENTQTAPMQEISLKNFDQDFPPCLVQFPVGLMTCATENCEISAHARPSIKSAKLTLSCIPYSAPTGFENPPPEAKIFNFHTLNSKGNISIINEVADEVTSDPMRELYFCIYKGTANLCGFVKAPILKDANPADGIKDFIEFVRALILTHPEGQKIGNSKN
jgi:hypothetical protein